MSHSLRERAVQILKSNDRGRHTIPSAHLYPHQWAWDSGFAAIGWSHIDLERACREVESILAGQWDDGRIPHIQFHNPEKDYFPGPDSWGREASSTISNPPVWTLAAERIHEMGADDHRVAGWLPALERSHRFLVENRDPLGWDCIATCHPWENGQDNCPAWDRPMEAIDPEEAPPFQRVDTKKVADASQRPTELQYKRYMTLVHRFRKNGFQMANFGVYDPFFTTLVILAEESLGRLCEKLSVESEAKDRALKLRQGLAAKLWSPELQRYRYYDSQASEFGEIYTSGSLAPVLLGPETPGYEKMKNKLRTDFWTEFGLPTVAPHSASFDPVCYWRGPTWVNMNWLFSKAMGEELVDKTLALVQKSGFWEYFHPETGQGLGTDGFTWTAALVLDMLVGKESVVA